MSSCLTRAPGLPKAPPQPLPKREGLSKISKSEIGPLRGPISLLLIFESGVSTLAKRKPNVQDYSRFAVYASTEVKFSVLGGMVLLALALEEGIAEPEAVEYG